eukprot:6190836-Pleurochrysis_carterae.AAC.8
MSLFHAWGEGLPASRRARSCGCHGVAATMRLATRHFKIAIPLLCRPPRPRYHICAVGVGREIRLLDFRRLPTGLCDR